MHPETSSKWMNNQGITQEIRGLIVTIEDYFGKCMVPKIESKLEAEAIATLKEISNFIPYALEIKEASDLIMIVKNLYNLVKAYDAYPTPNYSNVGYATGAIAYYCVQMSSGKGMFGFIQINEFNDVSSTDYSLYGAEKSAELLFSVKQA